MRPRLPNLILIFSALAGTRLPVDIQSSFLISDVVVVKLLEWMLGLCFHQLDHLPCDGRGARVVWFDFKNSSMLYIWQGSSALELMYEKDIFPFSDGNSISCRVIGRTLGRALE